MRDQIPPATRIQSRRRRSGQTLLVAACVGLAAIPFMAKTACAQVLIAGAGAEDAENAVQPPFLLPVQPTEIGEAMEDFRRFAGRKQWEKAFKHLEKVFNSTNNGLVLTADGILLPGRLIAREALLDLPPAGQDAYRLFFDAEAKKLLEQAQGPEELTKLSQIYSRFLVTSVGDVAADKLGDLHFEAGNFAQAVGAWRAILEQRPDSRISRGRLRVKIGIALARQGYWAEFRELLKVVEEQHATEKLTLAGREVSAVEHLRALAARNQKPASPAVVHAAGGLPADIPLSGNPEPLWQFQFFPPTDGTPGNQPGNQPGLRVQQMWGNASVSDLVPPVVADQSRLYANLLGYNLGIDLENGKLLWRSGRFFDVPQKAQQGGLTPFEQFGLATAAGRIWSVTVDTKNQNQNQGRQQQGAKFEIVAREAETGKQVFSSQEAAEMKDWNLRGTPLLAGERVYVAAGKVNQPAELNVLAMDAKDGSLRWSTTIGSYNNQQNNWYSVERGTQPSLVLHAGRLYVDTHSGSLVQLDAASGQIEWGLNYLSETTQMHRFWSPWGMRSEQFTVSPPQMVNGVLYFKGMRSRQLYAVDPQRPRVLWHRPVPRVATLIGVDERRFYLGGEDISAFDLATRKIVWSVRVNLGTSWAKPLITQGRIYHFSSRGIFEIDKAGGDVVHLCRGADLQSLGGGLLVTPKALLAISNLAITAYPLGDSHAPGKSETGGAAAVSAESGPVKRSVN